MSPFTRKVFLFDGGLSLLVVLLGLGWSGVEARLTGLSQPLIWNAALLLALYAVGALGLAVSRSARRGLLLTLNLFNFMWVVVAGIVLARANSTLLGLLLLLANLMLPFVVGVIGSFEWARLRLRSST